MSTKEFVRQFELEDNRRQKPNNDDQINADGVDEYWEAAYNDQPVPKKTRRSA